MKVIALQPRRQGKSWQTAAMSIATLLAASDSTIEGLRRVDSECIDKLIVKLKGDSK
tara:strand:+ start:17 stop:187 length:171 start_codon:yes stop_codon:yes gene_type:complete